MAITRCIHITQLIRRDGAVTAIAKNMINMVENFKGKDDSHSQSKNCTQK